jgi:hypothetical protein
MGELIETTTSSGAVQQKSSIFAEVSRPGPIEECGIVPIGDTPVGQMPQGCRQR